MNRRILPAPVVAVVAVMPALTACQPVVDYFGPRPDAALMKLAQAAEADAQILSAADPAPADLRQGQADALYAEIARLCGTQDGAVPESCQVERSAQDQPADPDATANSTDPAAVLTHARDTVLDQLTSVAGESRPLVTNQAIELSAAINAITADSRNRDTNTDGTATDSADSHSDSDAAPSLHPDALEPKHTKAARQLLDWEYQQSFGLDFARAFVETWLEPIIDTRLAAHAHLTAELQQMLATSGDVPQPAAGYEPAGLDLPHDAASAEQFVRALRELNAETWRAAAADEAARLNARTASTEWRDWLIAVAAYSSPNPLSTRSG